ncbi:MAG: hypothetical protein C5B50_11815, partial [Verrucomicrobia bacterium]
MTVEDVLKVPVEMTLNTDPNNMKAESILNKPKFPLAYLTALVGLILIPQMGLAGLNGTISCGQTVSNTTTNSGQVDQFSFSGAAGQMLSVGFWWSYCNVNFQASGTADIYYNPSGQLVATVSAYCGGNATSLTLSNTGTYTILVHASGYNIAATYNLSLQSVTGGGCASKVIVCGQNVATNTSFNSQMDAYSYSG